MESPLAIVLGFVEGRISPAEFENEVYHNDQLQQFLDDSATIPPDDYVGVSTLLFCLQEDYESPGDHLNVHGALVQFLQKRNIACNPTTMYSDKFDCILKASPKWLSVDLKWLNLNVLPEAGDRQKKELVRWLRDRLLKLFKYCSKPPRWIQGPPIWPMGKEGPLVFLGQLPVDNYFHDEAAVYIFHDPAIGTCETIIQVY